MIWGVVPSLGLSDVCFAKSNTIITTVAGNGTQGYSGDGGSATSASLNSPNGVFVDGSGNIYIADTGNHRIRRVGVSTGIITTVAGDGREMYSGDGGAATSASLRSPVGIFVDDSGNIYIADTSNQRIRRVAADTGIITTVVGNGTPGYSGDEGPAINASLYRPNGVFVDDSGDIYIVDHSNQRIRQVAADTETITTVVGDGFSDQSDYGRYSGDGNAATSASLNEPRGVFVDNSGNIYIADTRNHRVREVIIGQPATQLVFTTQPAPMRITSGAEIDFSTDLVVEARDAAGIRDIDFTGTVILKGTGVGSAVISNPSVSAVEGVATFSGLKISYMATVDGEAVALQATSGNLTPAISDSLTVDVLASRLVFSTQPSGSVSGLVLMVQPVVTAKDLAGNTDMDFDETITLSLGSGSGSLSGTLSTTAVNGVATFSDVVYTATMNEESFTLSANDQDEVDLDLNPVISAILIADIPAVTGDFDGDNQVTFNDFFLFADAFGSTDSRYDLNGNGVVDFSDFFLFADAFSGE